MKTTIILSALLGISVPALGATSDYETLTTMDELVQAGTKVGTIAQNTNYSGTVYTFDGNSAVTNIDNPFIAEKIAAGTGYLTVVAWVYNDGGANTNIFSTGGQTNGFKLDIKDNALLFTTKNVKDTPLSAAAVAVDEWTLVGFSLNLTGSGYSLLYDGEGETRHYTLELGGWNTPDPTTFAIASGNSDGIRYDNNGQSEAFRGSIANLSVLYSTDLLSNAAVAAAVGAMPEQVQAIPEPQTALLGLLALGLTAARRRRCL